VHTDIYAKENVFREVSNKKASDLSVKMNAISHCVVKIKTKI